MDAQREVERTRSIDILLSSTVFDAKTWLGRSPPGYGCRRVGAMDRRGSSWGSNAGMAVRIDCRCSECGAELDRVNVGLSVVSMLICSGAG